MAPAAKAHIWGGKRGPCCAHQQTGGPEEASPPEPVAEYRVLTANMTISYTQ